VKGDALARDSHFAGAGADSRQNQVGNAFSLSRQLTHLLTGSGHQPIGRYLQSSEGGAQAAPLPSTLRAPVACRVILRLRFAPASHIARRLWGCEFVQR
jgi:hypothetical protein